MGQFIVKLAGKYLVWSTIVDAPVSYGMDEAELREWIKDEYGEQGLRDLPARLARVEKKGTSALTYESAERTIWFNRAGPNETQLTVPQIIAEYITGPHTFSRAADAD
jgi:hypothetical protein